MYSDRAVLSPRGLTLWRRAARSGAARRAVVTRMERLERDVRIGPDAVRVARGVAFSLANRLRLAASGRMPPGVDPLTAERWACSAWFGLGARGLIVSPTRQLARDWGGVTPSARGEVVRRCAWSERQAVADMTAAVAAARLQLEHLVATLRSELPALNDALWKFRPI